MGVQFDEIAEVPAAVVVRRPGAQITEAEISKIVEGDIVFIEFMIKILI